jgi:hypothetical protein
MAARVLVIQLGQALLNLTPAAEVDQHMVAAHRAQEVREVEQVYTVRVRVMQLHILVVAVVAAMPEAPAPSDQVTVAQELL